MRDIRADLEERLSEVLKEGRALQAECEARKQEIDAEYEKRSEGLEEQYRLVQQLLLREQARFGSSPDSLPQSRPRLPLDDFFVRTLKRQGPLTKEDLRDLASYRRYFQDGENPGRVTHATLMNMERSGRIGRLENGEYVFRPEKVEGSDAIAAKPSHGSAASVSADAAGVTGEAATSPIESREPEKKGIFG